VAEVVGAQGVEVGAVGRVGHRVRVQQSAGVRPRAEGAAAGRGDGGRVDVHAGVLLLPLGAAVLEPDFDLENGDGNRLLKRFYFKTSGLKQPSQIV